MSASSKMPVSAFGLKKKLGLSEVLFIPLNILSKSACVSFCHSSNVSVKLGLILETFLKFILLSSIGIYVVTLSPSISA